MNEGDGLEIGRGQADHTHYDGYIDAVMVSTVARYEDDFVPVTTCSFVEQSRGSTSCAPTYVQRPPEDVVLLLDFEDERFVDRSQYGHAIDPNGDDVSIVATGVDGAYAAYLDSSDDINNYLVVEEDEDGALEFGGDFTIEAWVYFVEETAHSQYYAYQDIIASENYACQSGESGSFVLRRVPSGMVEVRIYDVSGSSRVATVDTSDSAVQGQYLSYKEWYHIAFVRNGTTSSVGGPNCHVYVNGTEWLSFRYDGTLNDNDGLEIGRGELESTHYAGYVDSVMASSYARYEAEFDARPACDFMEQLAASGTGSGCDVAYRRPLPADVVVLLDFEDQRFEDLTRHGHVLTANGSDVDIASVGFVGAASAHLDTSENINNFLVVKQDAVLELAGDFTIEAWVQFLDDTAHSQYYAYQDLIASENYAGRSGESGSFVLRRIPSGMVEVRIYDVSGSSVSSVVDTSDAAVSGQFIAYGPWNHIAFVRNGTSASSTSHNCHVYVNGSEWLSFAYNGVLNENDGFEIGRGQNEETHCNAYVDELMVTSYCRYVDEFDPETGCGFLEQLQNGGDCATRRH